MIKHSGLFELLASIYVNLATESKNFKINLEGQNIVHFYVILSRNVKIFGINGITIAEW